jgi:hypothetical protein
LAAVGHFHPGEVGVVAQQASEDGDPAALARRHSQGLIAPIEHLTASKARARAGEGAHQQRAAAEQQGGSEASELPLASCFYGWAVAAGSNQRPKRA